MTLIGSSGRVLFVVTLSTLAVCGLQGAQTAQALHSTSAADYDMTAMTMFQIVRRFAAEHPAETERVIRMISGRLGPEGVQYGNQLITALADPKDAKGCTVCKVLFGLLKLWARNGDSMQDTLDSAVEACIMLGTVLDPSIAVNTLCPGVVFIQGPHVFKILTKPGVFGSKFCEMANACYTSSAIVPGWPTKSESYASMATETGTATARKAAVAAAAAAAKRIRNRTNQQAARASARQANGRLSIAQLTDIHIEPDYAQGSATDCGLPVCCQQSLGSGQAGHFGHYNCNIPQRTIALFLDKVKELNADYVLFSGDIPPHTVWEETAQSQYDCSKTVVDLMEAAFRTDLGNETRVLPCLGNHELYPTNLFSLTYNNETRPIMSKFANLWTDLAEFRPGEKDNFKNTGWYSTQLIPGLRVLSLNSVYMYSANFYNVLNHFGVDIEPPVATVNFEAVIYKQKVRNELEQARSRREKVIIIGHHVLGSGDYAVTEAKWFEDLVVEFSDIIVLLAAGHTHNDEFRLFGDANNAVKAIQLVCPSMDAHGYKNPSVRVYELDDVTYELLDYTQYYFDISAIDYNDNNPPKIVELYSANKTYYQYGLVDMSPASWMKLLDRFGSDPVALELHRRYFHAGASKTGDFSCDEKCRLEHQCQMRYASFDRYDACIHQYDPQPTTTPAPTRPTLPILTGQPSLPPAAAAVWSKASGIRPGQSLLLFLGILVAAAEAFHPFI